MASSTEIANLALRHLASGKEIQNLDTDNSQEANTCRRFFDTCRKMILNDFPWPFATKIADLALVEEDPNDDWDFSYRYPSDCLMIRRILSGIRTDSRQTRIPYKISRDDTGLLIFTDQSEATIEYTIDDEDYEFYPSDVLMALSFMLAMYAAPSITAGDPYKMGARAAQMYELHLSQAKASAANEEQADQEPESEFVRARGEGGYSQRFGFGFDPNNL